MAEEDKRTFIEGNLYLTGFMGCGKTEISRKLAELTGLEHADTDTLIEERAGTVIADIFEEKGEEEFRKLEGEVLQEVSKRSGCVVSTGGGVMESEYNRITMERSGIILFLDTPFDICLERILGKSGRPLVEGISEQERISYLKELHKLRLKNYRKCDTRIPLDSDDVVINCNILIKKLEKQKILCTD